MGSKSSKELSTIPLAYYVTKPKKVKLPSSITLPSTAQASVLSNQVNVDQNETNKNDDDEEGLDSLVAKYGALSVKTLTFCDLETFTNIALCSHNILQLSPHVGLLKAMVCIQMCCNQLARIPREIGHLSNLTILDLSKNRLKLIPDTIGHLTKLTELKLSHNSLTRLPPSIGTLTKLTTLNVSNNKILRIPRECGNLKSLITLDLSDNPITILPAEVGQLQFLRRLKLENCPLLTEQGLEKLCDSNNYEPKGPLSLKELSARAVVAIKSSVPLDHLPSRVYKHLLKVSKCSFCHGPYFDNWVVRARMIDKSEQRIPLEYRLCSNHWNNDSERVSLLFCGAPESMSPTSTLISASSSNLQVNHSNPSLGRRRRSNSHNQTSFSRSSTSSISSTSSTSIRLPTDTIRSASRYQALLSRMTNNRSMNQLNRPLPLSEVLEKTPQLPNLPINGTISTPRSLSRGSFTSRRSLSIYVP